MTLLPPQALARRWGAEAFDFETTGSLAPLEGVIGQARAIEALDLAAGIAQPGFNVVVLGAPETACLEVTLRRVREQAASQPVPDRWCYVNNFRDPVRPSALRLPGRAGEALRSDMRQLVDELRTAIPAVLESDEYRARVEQVEAHFDALQQRAFGALVEEAQRAGVALLRTPAGFSLVPARGDEVMPHEEFEKLPDEEKERIAKAIAELQDKLERVLRQATGWRRDHREEIRRLNREVTTYAVGNLVDDMIRRYVAVPAIVAYLEEVGRDVVENAQIFLASAEGAAAAQGAEGELPPLRRYMVNLLVEDGAAGAPVVVEENPSYANLVGRIEHIARYGALVSDFGLIRPGALHRANGGYLLVGLRKLLSAPFAWDALKRALLTREIRIESVGQQYGFVSTVSLEPQPIPLDLKVVLFADRLLHALVQAWDPEFAELFKVAADFEDDARIDEASLPAYARLVASLVRDSGLPPLDADAVGRVIEYAARLAGDRERLTLHVNRLRDLLTEAAYQARRRRNGARVVAGESGTTAAAAAAAARTGDPPVIGRADVQAAIDARRERTGRIARTLQERIAEGTIRIDTSGAEPGQINGLSVFALGEAIFGLPTRITATTRVGEGTVVDIQREASLSGAIHSKGVLILSSFLVSRYAARQAFALNATLAFEQTYGTVDGDSASLAELCAILSSLSGIALLQSFAVTGAVDQRGTVLAIGAVNEKIEGFFDLCVARGLDGRHGVLIPQSNVRHLMLRDDIVEAVGNERFCIHSVCTVDEALQVLTGRDDVDAIVRARLADFVRLRRRIAEPLLRRAMPRAPDGSSRP